MRRLLLDTPAWLWLAEGDHLFTPSTLLAIEEAVRQNALFLSPISLWEIGLKHSRHRLKLSLPLRPWMTQALDYPGLHLLAIESEIACCCAELPAEFHGDPADRIIAATARAEGLTLLTQDRLLLQLAKQGYFSALAI